MKLVVLLVFSILRHNDVITVLYWKYDFRFEIRVSKLVYNTLDWSTGAQITENMLNQSVPLCTSSGLWLFCLESSIIL